MTRLMRKHRFPPAHSVRIAMDYVQWSFVNIDESAEFILRANMELMRRITVDSHSALQRCADAVILNVQTDVILASGGFND